MSDQNSFQTPEAMVKVHLFCSANNHCRLIVSEELRAGKKATMSAGLRFIFAEGAIMASRDGVALQTGSG